MEGGEGAGGGLEVGVARVVERAAGEVLLDEQAVRDLGAGGVDVEEGGGKLEWSKEAERVCFVEDLLVAGGDLLGAGGDTEDDAAPRRAGGGEVIEVVFALGEL